MFSLISMTLLSHLQQTLINKDIAPTILGQEKVKHDIKSALLMGRHIILVGPPGIGKTTLARQLISLLPTIEGKAPPFVRVQGSPDLTAEDLLGDIDPIKALEFGPLSSEAFTPGKILKANGGILFFDEINRAPQKLQNALLQVLEERKATIGSYDVDFPTNFILIATMNPADETTEELSSVFLDRFDLVYVTYPETTQIETKIIRTHGKVLDNIAISDELVQYIVNFVRRLRNSDKLLRQPSVRATLGLYERSQANALLAGRNIVTQQDIHAAIHSVLAHRIEMKPSVKYLQSPAAYLDEQITQHQHAAASSKEADVP